MIIAFDNDDWLYVFGSPAEAEVSLETPEVESGEYRGFDEQGARVRFGVRDGAITVEMTAATEADELRRALQLALSKRGIPHPSMALALAEFVQDSVASFNRWAESGSRVRGLSRWWSHFTSRSGND